MGEAIGQVLPMAAVVGLSPIPTADEAVDNAVIMSLLCLVIGAK